MADRDAHGLRTRLSDRLAIRYPIVQAPIGSAATPELAAAVATAGGLGMLAVSWVPPRDVSRACRETARLTRGVFGVNVVLVWPQHDRIARALDAGVRVMSTSWGAPGRYAEQVHGAGGILVHMVGSREQADEAVAEGVDAIVAQGREAGGHVHGTVPWRELLAQIRQSVRDVPIIAAGGIADGRDIATALSLGADGVWMGTRFVCSTEANASEAYQRAIIDARGTDTVLTGVFDKGWPDAPHRVIRNSTVRRWEAAGCPASGERPGERDRVAVAADGSVIERYSDVIPTRGVSGDLEALALYAGESCDRIHDVRPAAELVAQLACDAARTLTRMGSRRID